MGWPGGWPSTEDHLDARRYIEREQIAVVVRETSGVVLAISKRPRKEPGSRGRIRNAIAPPFRPA